MKRLTRYLRARRSSEEGYNLVVMVIVITAFNVMVASAWPLWSAFAQREKEEELIFRGLQYAEAIRVFQKRFGRYPNRLQELVEVEPRSIRQLWEDPMTEDGEWGLIFGTGQGRGNQPKGAGRRGMMADIIKDRQDQKGKGETGGSTDPGSGQQPGQQPGLGNQGSGLSGSPGQPTRGPISGVFSKSDESGFKSFFGQTSYREWKFTADLVSQPPMGPNGVRTPHIGPRTLGRPFRGEISVPGAGPGNQPGSGLGQPTLPRPGSGPQGGGKGDSRAPDIPMGSKG